MDIDKFLENGERECKEAADNLPRDLWETYSAFANTRGGTIYLGIKEKNGKFSVSGVNNADKVIKEFWDNLNNNKKASMNILSDNDVSVEKVDGKDVIKIFVPRADRRQKPIFIGDNPYNDNKHSGTFRRNHSGDYKCNKQEVDRMIADSSDISQDSVILEGFGIEDLNVKSVRSYKNRLESKNPNHPWLDLDMKQFLYKIGAYGKNRSTGEEGITYAGLLMFGEDREITDEFPKYFLDYREKSMDSNIRWENRVTSNSGLWSGNIYDFYFMIVNELTMNLKVPFKLVNGVRQDSTLLHEAIREALANALIHADYRVERGIVVEKGENYFKFSNPGTLRVSLEEAIDGGISDPRNENIFKMFNLLGIGERAGSGIGKIAKIWNDENWIKPQLKESFSPDRVELVLSMISADEKFDKKNANDNVTKLDKKSLIDEILSEFSREEIDIILITMLEDTVNNSYLQQVLGKDSKYISKILKKIVAKGGLEVSGTGRGTEYSLSNDVMDRIGLENIEIDVFKKEHLSQDESLVMDFVSKNGYVTTKMAIEILDMNKSKARKVFDLLVGRGKLEKIGSGPKTRYISK